VSVAAPISAALRPLAAGLAVDQRSWQAGYDAGIAGSRRGCPEGFDLFSFYLGRAAACPGGPQIKSNQGE
jgi:hypothetical protein